MTTQTSPARIPILSTTLVLILGLAAIATAHADITLKGRSGLVALNMPNLGQEALYLKRDRLRRDLTDRGRNYSFLYDLTRREVTYIDHAMRQATTRNLAAVAKGQEGSAVREMKLKLTPTGRKQGLGPWTCVEHDIDASLPAEMANKEQVLILLTGRLWIAPKTKEQQAFDPFIKSIQAQDFFIGATAQGRVETAQTQGVKEVLRRVLPRGMLCAADFQLSYEGNGPMANLGRRMATRMSIVYNTYSADPLEDSLFEIPQNYRVNRAD
jgi:hypothetical protein